MRRAGRTVRGVDWAYSVISREANPMRGQLASRGALLSAALVAGLLVSLWACETVPVTGRRALVLIPNSEMLSMSFNQYGDFMKKNPPSKDQAATRMVQTVGTRIQHSVEQFFAQQNMSDRLNGYQWEFNLVDNKEANAWCMPGGKVVVYSGILPITKDETGLAVVLGHEISHAVANHGSERMSQGLLAQFGSAALGELVKDKPAETQQIWMTAFGVGAQYGALLPFSRVQESEADHLGLIFMAMAGYDPRTAVDFWQRMAQQGGAKPPEFLSTHPSDATRIQKVREELPEALRYYKKG